MPSPPCRREWYPVITLTYRNVKWWRKAGTTLQRHPVRFAVCNFDFPSSIINPETIPNQQKTQTIDLAFVVGKQNVEDAIIYIIAN